MTFLWTTSTSLFVSSICAIDPKRESSFTCHRSLLLTLLFCPSCHSRGRSSLKFLHSRGWGLLSVVIFHCLWSDSGTEDNSTLTFWVVMITLTFNCRCLGTVILDTLCTCGAIRNFIDSLFKGLVCSFILTLSCTFVENLSCWAFQRRWHGWELSRLIQLSICSSVRW